MKSKMDSATLGHCLVHQMRISVFTTNTQTHQILYYLGGSRLLVGVECCVQNLYQSQKKIYIPCNAGSDDFVSFLKRRQSTGFVSKFKVLGVELGCN